ncbi:hypothetical protein [Nocardia sp. NPDC051832]|uniref:hypothetical protein n=1 Tax=Nocardia sp. NPDC051832 TaxID=3155673 RepID=UPI0034180938
MANDLPLIPGLTLPSTTPAEQPSTGNQLTSLLGVESLIKNYVDHTRKVDSEIDGDSDPNYVKTEEAFRSMTHQEIYDAVQKLDASKMSGLQDMWLKFSQLSATFTMQSIYLTKATDGRWEGSAADAAAAASKALTAAGDKLGKTGLSVASRLESVYYSTLALQAAVPAPPASTTPDPDNPEQSVLPGLTNGEHSRSETDAAVQARLAAIAAMETTYVPNIPPAGNQVPAFQAAPELTGNGNPNNLLNGNPNTGQPNSNPANQNPQSPAEKPDETTPANNKAPTTNPSNSGAPDSTTPASTSPASTAAPASNAPGPNAPATNAPTQNPAPGSTSPGIPGSPGTPGAGKPATPGLGTTRPVAPGAGAPGAGVGNTSSAAGKASQRAVPMGGPMAGRPAGGRKDDDENTRGIPDYLVRQQSEWTEGIETPVDVIGNAQMLPADLVETAWNPAPPSTGTPTPPLANTDNAATAAAHAPGEDAVESLFSHDETTPSAPAETSSGSASPAATLPAASDSTPESESEFEADQSSVDHSELYDPDLVVEHTTSDDPDANGEMTISGIGPMMDDDDTPDSPR